MFAAIVFAAVNTRTDHSNSGEEQNPMMTPAGTRPSHRCERCRGTPDAAAMVIRPPRRIDRTAPLERDQAPPCRPESLPLVHTKQERGAVTLASRSQEQLASGQTRLLNLLKRERVAADDGGLRPALVTITPAGQTSRAQRRRQGASRPAGSRRRDPPGNVLVGAGSRRTSRTALIVRSQSTSYAPSGRRGES